MHIRLLSMVCVSDSSYEALPKFMRTCSNPGNIWRVHQALKVMDLVGGGANKIDHSGNDLLCVSERQIELVSCLKEKEREELEQ